MWLIFKFECDIVSENISVYFVNKIINKEKGKCTNYCKHNYMCKSSGSVFTTGFTRIELYKYSGMNTTSWRTSCVMLCIGIENLTCTQQKLTLTTSFQKANLLLQIFSVKAVGMFQLKFPNVPNISKQFSKLFNGFRWAWRFKKNI